MMDVVSALSKYRISAVDDENIYFIMHVIYKDMIQTEAGIEQDTGLPPSLLKKIIRELYQANFVKLHREGRLSLTNFAEDVLAKLGADSTVIPYLIDEIVPKSASKDIRVLAAWALNVEPERCQMITQSLRNLKIYAENRNLSEDMVRISSIMCIAPWHSKSRSLLQTEMSSRDIFLHFSAHGATELDTWNIITTKYREATNIADASDMILINACRSEIEWARISKPVSEFLSFRTYNYLFCSDRDQIFESCIERMHKDNARSVWAGIWHNVSDVFATVANYFYPGPNRIENEQDLISAVMRRVTQKQEGSSGISRVFFERDTCDSIDQALDETGTQASDSEDDVSH